MRHLDLRVCESHHGRPARSLRSAVHATALIDVTSDFRYS